MNVNLRLLSLDSGKVSLIVARQEPKDKKLRKGQRVRIVNREFRVIAIEPMN